jgi:hypothetical protein
MAHENDQRPAKQPADAHAEIKSYLNPVTILAAGMLFAIVLLIGASTLGLDKGLVLAKMGQVEFARGLITYLFAVVTIGTAVVLVVSALTTEETPANERRFERGKEILSLLLGVFGTIVGFYFGSEVAAKSQTGETLISVVPIHLSATTVAPGAHFNLTTYVTGGRAPYRFATGYDDDAVKPGEPVEPGGWILKTLTAPSAAGQKPVTLHMVVEDADGHSTDTTVPMMVTPVPPVKPNP